MSRNLHSLHSPSVFDSGSVFCSLGVCIDGEEGIIVQIEAGEK